VSVALISASARTAWATPTALKRIGAELGFEVKIVEEVASAGEKVSSSRIRESIERGDVEKRAGRSAATGSPTALVEHGESAGHGSAFPTATCSSATIVHFRRMAFMPSGPREDSETACIRESPVSGARRLPV